MNKLFKNAYRLIDAAQRAAKTREGAQAAESVQIYEGWAGREEVVELIAAADWNTITHYDQETRKFVDDDDIMRRLGDALEAIGVEIVWSDQVSGCSDCGLLIETEPTHYGWKAQFYVGDGEILCADCLASDPEEYLESLEGNERTANTLDNIDPGEHGYVLAKGDMEHGFHRGQDDDPKVVAKALRARGIDRFLFQIDSCGQFDTRFSVWVHEDEADKLVDEIPSEGPSVSAAMERGLREVSLKMGELKGEGIRYATVNADGTADVRLVSPEEFVRGIDKK